MPRKPQHSRYDSWVQSVIAWLAYMVTVSYCAVKKPTAGRHALPPAPVMPWPDGADLAYAEQLRAMQDTVVMRAEVRA